MELLTISDLEDKLELLKAKRLQMDRPEKRNKVENNIREVEINLLHAKCEHLAECSEIGSPGWNELQALKKRLFILERGINRKYHRAMKGHYKPQC